MGLKRDIPEEVVQAEIENGQVRTLEIPGQVVGEMGWDDSGHYQNDVGLFQVQGFKRRGRGYQLVVQVTESQFDLMKWYLAAKLDSMNFTSDDVAQEKYAIKKYLKKLETKGFENV